MSDVMSVVLKLNTKKSLFQPVDVEIDNVKLRVKEITLGTLETIQSLQTDAAAGSAKAIRENLEALLEGDTTILLKLPISQLAELISVVVEKAIKPSVEEKNASGPGDKSSLS